MRLKRNITALFLSMMIILSGLTATDLSAQAATSSVTASNVSSGIKVKWAQKTSATGTKYHSRICGGGNFIETTLADAKNRGLTPCAKCF